MSATLSLDDYSFELPEDLIARHPLPDRDNSRLLHVRKESGLMRDGIFHTLPKELSADDLLVFNRTRVSPRRVELRRLSGGRISSLFLHPENKPENRLEKSGRWICLLRGSGKLREGEILEPYGAPSPVRFRYESCAAPENESGTYSLLEPIMEGREDQKPIWENHAEAEHFFQEFGVPPIPPYLKRPAEKNDTERYGTVYARKTPEPFDSVAAPTAGLHFTPETLTELGHRGIQSAWIELSVGYGTFAPLKKENLQKKLLHPESFLIPEEAAVLLNQSRDRIIAVGTTSLRALESNYREHGGTFRHGSYTTSIFLHPPDKIESVQGLITNFHLPQSSLFLLVCAFMGREAALKAYHHAIKTSYRFYSYGDAMIVL